MPQPKPMYHSKAARSTDAVHVLLLAAFPLALWLLRGDADSIVFGGLVLGLLLISARFLMTGLRIQHGELIRPKDIVPRKVIGSGIMGIAVGFMAWFQLAVPINAVILGCTAAGLCFVAFGPDKIDKEVLKRVIQRRSGANAGLLETADRVLNAMVLRIAMLDDEVLTAHTEAFAKNFTNLVTKDPAATAEFIEEIRSVITEAAVETDQFYITYSENPTPMVKRRYVGTLSDLATLLKEYMFGLDPNEGLAGRRQSESLFDEMSRKSAP